MKKLMSLFMVALLALGANVSAQEETSSGAAASGSTIGGIATTNVVIGAVALGVAAAIISNQDDDDDGVVCRTDQVEVGGVCQCPPGQVEVNGQCVPDTGPECDQGGVLEGDVCVITEFVTQTVTITVDGQATTTLTQVPVITTYTPTGG